MLCNTARKSSREVVDNLRLTSFWENGTTPLDCLNDRCFPWCMGRLLDKLIQGAPAYDVKSEKDGFTLVGKPDRLDEFSELVREAAAKAGEEFVVFTTSDGHHRYSQMFVMPLDEPPSR